MFEHVHCMWIYMYTYTEKYLYIKYINWISELQEYTTELGHKYYRGLLSEYYRTMTHNNVKFQFPQDGIWIYIPAYTCEQVLSHIWPRATKEAYVQKCTDICKLQFRDWRISTNSNRIGGMNINAWSVPPNNIYNKPNPISNVGINWLQL